MYTLKTQESGEDITYDFVNQVRLSASKVEIIQIAERDVREIFDLWCIENALAQREEPKAVSVLEPE